MHLEPNVPVWLLWMMDCSWPEWEWGVLGGRMSGGDPVGHSTACHCIRTVGGNCCVVGLLPFSRRGHFDQKVIACLRNCCCFTVFHYLSSHWLEWYHIVRPFRDVFKFLLEMSKKFIASSFLLKDTRFRRRIWEVKKQSHIRESIHFL